MFQEYVESLEWLGGTGNVSLISLKWYPGKRNLNRVRVSKMLWRKSRIKIMEAPIMACLHYNRKFYLQTDASDRGIITVLFQQDEEGEHVISYGSRSLNRSEHNYTTTEK